MTLKPLFTTGSLLLLLAGFASAAPPKKVEVIDPSKPVSFYKHIRQQLGDQSAWRDLVEDCYVIYLTQCS